MDWDGAPWTIKESRTWLNLKRRKRRRSNIGYVFSRNENTQLDDSEREVKE
jgi:hypothetical protein